MLEQELLFLEPQCRATTLQEGLVGAQGTETLPYLSLAFARQVLPSARHLSASTIKEWVAALASAIEETVNASSPRSSLLWHLQVSEIETAIEGTVHNRGRLIEKELVEYLKKKRRGIMRLRCNQTEEASILFQFLLISPSSGFFSSAQIEASTEFRQRTCSYRPAGYVTIPDDKRAPSRAFKKLEEAAETFGLTFIKGQQCVDLGGAPGGWTYSLVQRGCRVTAVDRALLDTRLLQNPLIESVKGNAFTWCPEKEVDWLVCDVITTPDKTIELLSRWLEKRWCRKFCVTMKFKGAPDFKAIDELRTLLAGRTSWYGLKQLLTNKNELTIAGEI